ncbi:hypothetical protein P7C73_g4613, partial [Tremellales sp. Uapishka_1]
MSATLARPENPPVVLILGTRWLGGWRERLTRGNRGNYYRRKESGRVSRRRGGAARICDSDLRIHTVHNQDIAQALHLLSIYLLITPRNVVLRESACDIPFTFTPASTSTFSLGSSKRSSVSETWKTIASVVPASEKIAIPLFNVVDENDSTQEKLAKVVAETWGIKYGFLNSTVASLVANFAKVCRVIQLVEETWTDADQTDFAEMVEDVNEMHVEAWSKMLATSSPPIDSSPITPFLDEHAFRKMAISLDGSKAKRILGFKATKPEVEVEELRLIVRGFQDNGIW